jgi:hypothetical protein
MDSKIRRYLKWMKIKTEHNKAYEVEHKQGLKGNL